jgi:hypothetical protein
MLGDSPLGAKVPIQPPTGVRVVQAIRTTVAEVLALALTWQGNGPCPADEGRQPNRR